MLRSDFIISQIRWTASFLLLLSHHRSPVRYDLAHIVRYDTILCLRLSLRERFDLVSAFVYDINLRATTTTILSTRGVTIPIDLVSSATDSIKAAHFKPVTIPTSDLKSEFLCQSSYTVQNLQTPRKHLVRLGHLPCPRHHVSPLLSQPECSHRVPEAQAQVTTSKATRSQPPCSSRAERSARM